MTPLVIVSTVLFCQLALDFDAIPAILAGIMVGSFVGAIESRSAKQ